MKGTVPESEASQDAILTYITLRDPEALCKALLEDLTTGKFDDVYRDMGLTRVTYWIQRDPDAAVTMWEGRDLDTLIERFGTSSSPILAEWRGLIRLWSGPDEEASFWEAEHHRLLSWSAEEPGSESQLMVFRDPRQVQAYREFAEDFQDDPSLFRLLDRVRRQQGFTRIETWHQRVLGEDIVLTVAEAHNLNDATAQLMAENNELDRRVMELVRKTLLGEAPPRPPAALLYRWSA